jgi:hypothetical protein
MLRFATSKPGRCRKQDPCFQNLILEFVCDAMSSRTKLALRDGEIRLPERKLGSCGSGNCVTVTTLAVPFSNSAYVAEPCNVGRFFLVRNSCLEPSLHTHTVPQNLARKHKFSARAVSGSGRPVGILTHFSAGWGQLSSDAGPDGSGLSI